MLSNMRIGFRLSVGFSIVLVLLLMMAAASFWQSGNLAADTAVFSKDLVPSFKIQGQVALNLANIRRWEYRHIVSFETSAKDDSEARIKSYQAAIATAIDLAAKNLVHDDSERRALDEVRAAIDGYYAEWEKVRTVSRAAVTDRSKAAEAERMTTTTSSAAYQAADKAVVKWGDANSAASEAQNVHAQAVYSQAKLTLIVLVIAALGLGIGAAVVITRSIVVPIQQAVQVASTVAEGDLTARIDVRGADETAQLLQALKHMNEGLVAVVSKVRQSSDSIATGSTQIAAGTVDLSQRTEEQASNLEETAASMEQLTSTVKTNAETAHQASELADAAAKAAANGGAVVQQVIETMDGISQSSKKIADIIGVIDGIAFQTNILALNAAVEAARAGEQGRGFAVVASEVRALAQRSAGAAKEIKLLISDSVEKVDAGSRQVNDAGKSMEEIVSQVQRVNRLIGEISSATSEQTSGINQVGDAVTQLDQVTQQNAALVEESAAAADSLKHQAGQLLEAVSVFKLAAGGPSLALTRAEPSTATVAKNQVSTSIHKLAHTTATPRKAKAKAPAAAREPKLAQAEEASEWETF